MKALGILASPREKGNAAQMLECAMEEARQGGCAVELINLSHQRIAFCKGCMACKKTGNCVIDDDVTAIRNSLRACDLVVIACPTYFANVTAPLKALFDRLVGAVMDDNDGMIPKPKLSKAQKYVLLTTCSTPAPFDWLAGQSAGCMKAMKEVLHISGMTCGGKVTFAGTRGKTKPPEAVLRKIRCCVKSCCG